MTRMLHAQLTDNIEQTTYPRTVCTMTTLNRSQLVEPQ